MEWWHPSYSSFSLWSLMVQNVWQQTEKWKKRWVYSSYENVWTDVKSLERIWNKEIIIIINVLDKTDKIRENFLRWFRLTCDELEVRSLANESSKSDRWNYYIRLIVIWGYIKSSDIRPRWLTQNSWERRRKKRRIFLYLYHW